MLVPFNYVFLLVKAEQVRFLAEVQNLEIKRVVADAKVIMPEQGSVAMNRDVTLGSCTLLHKGNLSVTVNSQVNVKPT